MQPVKVRLNKEFAVSLKRYPDTKPERHEGRVFSQLLEVSKSFMPTAQQDTEITLGTGRMLAMVFSALVLVCAFFFSIGFSLGRRTTSALAC